MLQIKVTLEKKAMRFIGVVFKNTADKIILICRNIYDRMANVLSIVTYRVFPAETGGQRAICFFNRYLSQKQRLCCFTVKPNDPSFASYKVFNYLADRPSRYINPFYYITLRRIIKENAITHVILEHPYYGWMGLLLKYFSGVRLIIRSHNIESERFRTIGKWWWKMLRYYEKCIHRRADFTFCITESDRNYFYEKFRVPLQRSAVITYGITVKEPPAAGERQEARQALLKKYALPEDTRLFLFNGSLDYLPNTEAVKNIVEKINPLFIRKGIAYKILICGKGLPAEMDSLSAWRQENIIYAGFVDDIAAYFKGADAFISPVTGGGGIKTKLVEALGFELSVVSTESGAIGVAEELCNGKLLLCRDGDWTAFAENMERSLRITASVTPAFFEHFSWKHIAARASAIIDSLR